MDEVNFWWSKEVSQVEQKGIMQLQICRFISYNAKY